MAVPTRQRYKEQPMSLYEIAFSGQLPPARSSNRSKPT